MMREKYNKVCNCRKIKGILLLLMTGVFCVSCGETAENTKIEGLETNSRNNPIAIEADDICFGWRWESEENAKQQTAYEIYVTEADKEEYLWTSGKIESEESAYIPYEGPRLENAQKYDWQVKAWDENGKCYTSEKAFFVTAPAQQSWENADWISAPQKREAQTEASEFEVEFDCWTQHSTVSFLYGAKSNQYDPHIRWELDASGEKVVYKLQDSYANQEMTEELDIPSELLTEQNCHILLKVHNGVLTTYMDGQEIAEDVVTMTSLGGFGFYQGRNYQSSYYDNLVVRDETGVLFQEDFSNQEDTLFTPYRLQITEGILQLRHDYALTNTTDTPAPIFTKKFEIKKEIKEAYFYCTALGIYAGEINGSKIGDAFFAPGRQSYLTQIKYDAYDVTELLQQGENEIQLCLGHGWFDRAGYSGESPLGIRAQLFLCYADGKREVLGTDESWKCDTDGPIRSDDMYNGEFYDANYIGKEKKSEEKAVVNQIAERYLKLPLVANEMEKMKQIRTITPISVEEPIPGVFVYDFGQEFSGIIAIEEMTGKKGDCVTFQFAEEINRENLENADDVSGTVWTDNLLMAQNTNYYIFGEEEKVSYQPKLVCTAFRYVQIEGLETAVEPDKIKGIVISSDLEENGTFVCSDEKINQLYQNIQWTQLSNFLDIPTDCPQRDERFGWTGDAQAFARSAAYNRDTYHFMNNYLFYLREGQDEKGAYPDIAPFLPGGAGNNGWADAGVTITWNQYLQYGDMRTITDNMDAMIKYIDYLVNTSENYVRNNGGFGDHNAVVETPMELTNTALCAYSAGLVAKMAQIVGEEEEAKRLYEIAEHFKKAWQDTFVNEDGSIDCWTQAAYTLGLAFDLFDETQKQQAQKHLLTCLNYADMHLNTGYIATPFLLSTLMESGNAKEAEQVLTQETYPSWLYQVNQGATTIHEKWNSIVQTQENEYYIQGSLNHYGLGSVNEYFYRYILGIEVDEKMPGFKHIILKPTVMETLSYAKGSYESIYGTIESAWEKDENGTVTYTFSIPANTTATLYLNGQDEMVLTSGKHQISASHTE